MSKAVILVDFSDDVVMVVNVYNVELLEKVANLAMKTIHRKIIRFGLEPALKNTESLIIIKKRAYCYREMYLNGTQIPIKRYLWYLGLELDTKLLYGHHVTKVANNACH